MHQGMRQSGVEALVGHRQKAADDRQRATGLRKPNYKLPLQVGLIGLGNIINDGESANRLNIALTSTVPATNHCQITFQSSTVRPSTGVGQWKRTKIVVLIDTNDYAFADQKDWAMCNRGEAGRIIPMLSFEHADDMLFASANGTDAMQQAYWDYSFTSQGTRAEWIFAVPPAYAESHHLILPLHS